MDLVYSYILNHVKSNDELLYQYTFLSFWIYAMSKTVSNLARNKLGVDFFLKRNNLGFSVYHSLERQFSKNIWLCFQYLILMMYRIIYKLNIFKWVYIIFIQNFYSKSINEFSIISIVEYNLIEVCSPIM